MNTETRRVKEIVTRNPALVEAAKSKASDPRFVYAGMKNQSLALQLALSSTLSQQVKSLSFSALDKVDWAQVLD